MNLKKQELFWSQLRVCNSCKFWKKVKPWRESKTWRTVKSNKLTLKRAKKKKLFFFFFIRFIKFFWLQFSAFGDSISQHWKLQIFFFLLWCFLKVKLHLKKILLLVKYILKEVELHQFRVLSEFRFFSFETNSYALCLMTLLGSFCFSQVVFQKSSSLSPIAFR